MVEIVQNGHKILRQIAKPVSLKEIGSKAFDKILSDMREALASQDDGVALAAPQIAVSKRIFILSPIVFREEKLNSDFPTTYINPEIIKKSKDRKKMDEGCLSVRPLYGTVKRASRVTIKAMNERGESFEVTGTGLLAQIFQHETEHLDGILFIDTATDLKEIELPNSTSSTSRA